MVSPTLQTYYDVSSWMYGYATSSKLPPPPPGLTPFTYSGNRYDSGLLASGFHGAAFQTAGPNPEIVIGIEGTDIGGYEERPGFLLAQVEADIALYFGQVPQALRDAVTFAKMVIAAARADGYALDDITITGHSLGAGAAAYVSAVLGLDGVTFAAPGISTDNIPPSGAGDLTNYVEYGDPIGNYSFTPKNYEGDFLFSHDIRRVGDATYTGPTFLKQFLREQLAEAGADFAPGSSIEDRADGLAAFAALAALYHPLTTYGGDLGLDTDNTVSSGGGFLPAADYALVYGDIVDRSPLVSDAFYQLSYADVRAAGLDAEQHYEAFGWQAGRNPNAYFSTVGYRAANSDALADGQNPLTQYHAQGWQQGRDPGARFDVEFYLARHEDVAKAGIDPLAHYLQHGRAGGREIHDAIGDGRALIDARGFDAEYYLLSNRDVAAVALGSADPEVFAFAHYRSFGWRAGRDPNALFDTSAYLERYDGVRKAGIDPLAYYMAHGWKRGQDPSAEFDTSAYLDRYEDVAASGMNPLLHYLVYGIYGGRSPEADGMLG